MPKQDKFEEFDRRRVEAYAKHDPISQAVFFDVTLMVADIVTVAKAGAMSKGEFQAIVDDMWKNLDVTLSTPDGLN